MGMGLPMALEDEVAIWLAGRRIYPLLRHGSRTKYRVRVPLKDINLLLVQHHLDPVVDNNPLGSSPMEAAIHIQIPQRALQLQHHPYILRGFGSSMPIQVHRKILNHLQLRLPILFPCTPIG